MTDVLDLRNPGTRSRLARRLVSQARARAARSGLEFSIGAGEVERMFADQDGRCAVSDVPFSMTTVPGAFVRHPFGPSIDRISSVGGYTPDNVRLVCIATNFGLGQWGDEVLLVIATGVVEKAKVVTTDVDATALAKERLAAAEAVLLSLSEKEQRRQRRRIAALRRAITLGSAGLTRAAQRAWATRRRNA